MTDAYPTADAYMAACRALHWRTAQLRAVGSEPITLAADAPYYPPEDFAFPPLWTCFHCGETFTTREAAAAHFGDGTFEREGPVCVEAATTELKTLVTTNRDMWLRLHTVEAELEQAEYERDCWADAGRTAVNKPHATWHDLAKTREEMEGRVLAAEAALNAAPRWLAQLLRWNAERLWKRRRAKMKQLTREAEALG